MDVKSGMDFDQAYDAAAAEGHQKAVDLLSDAAKNAQNPDEKTLATESLPVIQQHLQMAQALARQIDATN
jgi:putative membrane protein